MSGESGTQAHHDPPDDGLPSTVGLSDVALQAAIHDWAAERQRCDAALLSLIAEADAREVAPVGRHRSIRVWLAADQRRSSRSAGRLIDRARLLFGRLPVVGDHYSRGAIHDDHLTVFVKIWKRRSFRDALERDIDELLELAERPFAEFVALMRAWETLVDPVDPSEHAARAEEKRGLDWAVGLDQTVLVSMQTTAATFAQIEAAIETVAQTLFERDWADAVAEKGQDARPSDLARSGSQRRHDAFVQLLRQGFGQVDPGVRPVVNIVVDEATIVRELTRRNDPERDECWHGPSLKPQRRREAPKLGRGELAAYRCETLSGVPISPADAVDHLLAGSFRRLVMLPKSLDFEASANQRFFSGAKKIGLQIRDRHCRAAGCDVTASRCEADHIVRHNDGGKTVPTNGQSLCPACHRHKTRLETLGLWEPAT